MKVKEGRGLDEKFHCVVKVECECELTQPKSLICESFDIITDPRSVFDIIINPKSLLIFHMRLYS